MPYRDSDESDLANVSRSLKRIPLIASFLSGTVAACICIPGIFKHFVQNNQLTVWRTREMAKVCFAVSNITVFVRALNLVWQCICDNF